MKNDKGFLGIFLAALVFLPGCMHVPPYKSVPLRSIGNNCTYRGIRQNVVVQAKLLNRTEMYALLKERVQKLYSYDVIYLSVNNLSKAPYVISSDSVGLAQADSKKIAQLIKQTSTAGRFAGSGVTALYAGLGINAFIRESATVHGVGDMGFVFLPQIVGGLIASLVMGIKGIKSLVTNNRVRDDLGEKTLGKVVVINSGEQYEGLIFVKASDYQSEFGITMYEKGKAKNTITFDVNLNKS